MDYLTFVEALRKRQVLQGMGDGFPKPLADFYRRQDWAIPSYDFGDGLVADLDANEASRRKLTDAFTRWVAEGRMRLPFPDCVFIHELTHHSEVHRREVTELVTRATEQDDGSIVLLNFGRRRGNSIIYRSPLLLRVETQQDGTGAAEMVTRVGVEEGADCDQAYRDAWSGMISLQVMLSAFMLTSVPPSDEAFTVTTQETSALQSANRGRVSTGLVPLPATSVIKLRLNEIDRLVWQKREGSHTLKSPHLRRGHERRYSDGKVVWIEATKVKGGTVPTPRTVAVEI